jgi:hypothetical protein
MPWNRPNSGRPYIKENYRTNGGFATDGDFALVATSVCEDMISLHQYLSALENTMAAVAEKAGIGRQGFQQMLRDAVTAEEVKDKGVRR